MKRILIIIALLSGLTSNSSYGQIFAIESFDGDKQLIEVSSGTNESILSIKCEKDTIHIGSLNSIDTIRMLNKHFLMVTYRVRTGVGMQQLKILIVSVNNHILRESLHAVSLFKEEFMDFSKPAPQSTKVSVETIYKADFSLTGSNSKNYQIKTIIHNKRKSIDDPKRNYNNDLFATLTFDRIKNIFHSSQESISQQFTVMDAKTKVEAKQYMKGSFSVVKLGKLKYYYKDGEWYEQFDSNSLIQESYR